MNCRHFQNRLYEYVEGSLSAGTQAAADKHLVACSACRQALRKEQQRAQFLSGQFRQRSETLALRPEVRRRILASPAPAPVQNPIIDLWNRFAWPLGMAASLLLVATILLINHFSGARGDDPGAPSAVSIEASYRVPTCKFRQEGNLVLDTVSYETVVVSETLWTTKPIREKQERKMPL
jgi:predicted anti-sigma-YlaC factor YlaD